MVFKSLLISSEKADSVLSLRYWRCVYECQISLEGSCASVEQHLSSGLLCGLRSLYFAAAFASLHFLVMWGLSPWFFLEKSVRGKTDLYRLEQAVKYTQWFLLSPIPTQSLVSHIHSSLLSLYPALEPHASARLCSAAYANLWSPEAGRKLYYRTTSCFANK